MGCFFGCFRVKDTGANLVTPSEAVAPRSKNALSSLFLTDEESIPKGEESWKQLTGELDVGETKDEAKFLKACGTLPKTPVNIQKALEKWERKSAPNEAEKFSEFNTCLQNATIEKLALGKQSDELPTPVKICEELGTRSGSFLDSPSSCMTDGRNTERAFSSSSQRRDVQIFCAPMVMCDSEARSEVSSFSTEAFSTSVKCKQKSLHFQPTENPSHGNELKDENYDSNLPSESVKLNDDDNLMSTPVSDPSVRKEMDDESSLSSWFKPISARKDNNNRFSSFHNENVHRRRIPVDRPILGMVAAHWNDQEPSHISPKWWDGNGIPNSTNKYKEDQKVSWHATPFEERLEKALSEETLVSQRKHINKTPPFELNEPEEADTALSHTQSSPHLKSVVSF